MFAVFDVDRKISVAFGHLLINPRYYPFKSDYLLDCHFCPQNPVCVVGHTSPALAGLRGRDKCISDSHLPSELARPGDQ